MIQSTSLDAFDQVQHKLPDCRRIVLEIIEAALPDITNMEIAQQLGWSINRVTPRVKELREMDLVEQSSKRPCEVTGNTALAWRRVCGPAP